MQRSRQRLARHVTGRKVAGRYPQQKAAAKCSLAMYQKSELEKFVRNDRHKFLLMWKVILSRIAYVQADKRAVRDAAG